MPAIVHAEVRCRDAQPVTPSPTYTPPSWPPLRWLAEPGGHVPAHIRDVLLGEMLFSFRAVLAGVVSGLILNVAGLLLHPGPMMRGMFVLQCAVSAVRLLIVWQVARARAAGAAVPMDAYLGSGLAWAATQGAAAYACMVSGDPLLQVLSAISVMALVGPICARNFPAPRLAMALIGACTLPMDLGACVGGGPPMLVLFLQFPLFLWGTMTTTRRFQALAVQSLLAEHAHRRDARHDALTGLPNRLGLAEAVACHAATGARLTLFCLDLDGFKAVNDRFGHQAGDALLCAVAQRLRAGTRAADTVARLGGDEFMVIAPDLSEDQGRDLAHAFVARIAGDPFALDTGSPVGIGISVGYASGPGDGTTFGDLYRKADEALYRAKQAGKGRCSRYAQPDGRMMLAS